MTLVDGLPSVDALQRVGDEVPGHKSINLIHGGKTPLLPADELARIGFKMVLYSTPALYVAARAMLDSMHRLCESHDLGSIAGESVTFKQFQDLIESSYLARDEVQPVPLRRARAV